MRTLYGKETSLAQLRVQFFKYRQQEEESMSSFILSLRELFNRWWEWEPEGSVQDKNTARDQLILGLEAGAVQRELQRLVRREPTLSFSEACREAQALEGEYVGEEQAWTSRVKAPTLTHCNSGQMSDWTEKFKAEIRHEMQEQLSVLGRTLVEEIRQHLQPSKHYPHPDSDTFFRGQRRCSPPSNHSPAFQWDEEGRPICKVCNQPGHIQRCCPTKNQPVNVLN